MTTLLPPNVKVHLALGYIDMRKGIDGLTPGASSTMCSRPPARRSQPKRCNASPSSTQLRPIRGQTSAARQTVRQSRSLPLVTKMKAWFEMRFAQIPPRGGLADAIRYTLSRWDLLCRFLDDGRIELDTNTVERAIRPVTLGRKNHLFAGSDGGAHRWATVCSLITTAKLNDVEPFAYLRDVLERLSDGHPMSRIDDLLPCNWRPTVAAAA
jgi:transposase